MPLAWLLRDEAAGPATHRPPEQAPRWPWGLKDLEGAVCCGLLLSLSQAPPPYSEVTSNHLCQVTVQLQQSCPGDRFVTRGDYSNRGIHMSPMQECRQVPGPRDSLLPMTPQSLGSAFMIYYNAATEHERLLPGFRWRQWVQGHPETGRISGEPYHMGA